jgi:Leucine-rich repeat (LRR) protein
MTGPGEASLPRLPIPLTAARSGLAQAADRASRILSAVSSDALAVASALPLLNAPRMRRVGDDEFTDQSYEQLLRWLGAIESEDGPRTLEELVSRLAERAEEWGIELPNDLGAASKKNWILSGDITVADLDDLRICNLHLSDNCRIISLSVLRNSISGELKLPLMPNLTNFCCSDNQITALDLSSAGNIVSFYCAKNSIASLDLSPVKKLKELHCWQNRITRLDLSLVTQLTKLSCCSNQITDLDLSPVPHLTELYCHSNQITDLDLSPVPQLTSLWCDSNQITDLDLSWVPNLRRLRCGSNLLTELDLSGVPNLMELDCSKNKLSLLDISCCKFLVTVTCDFGVRVYRRSDQKVKFV